MLQRAVFCAPSYLMSPPVADDNSAFAGNEPWNVARTVALARAWYGVSATPLGNGAGNRKGNFWVHLKANSGKTYALTIPVS